MINIVEHVEYLLRRHDCVIVPSLGAFLARMSSAHIDSQSMMFYPPFRGVSFNVAVNHNDGLLVSSVMRRYRFSYPTALAAVEEAVAVIKSRISAQGRINFGNIGILESSHDGKICFVPDGNSTADLYRALPKVELRKIVRQPNPLSHDAVSEFEQSIGNSIRPYLIKGVKWVAAVAVIVCIGLTLRMPFDTGSRTISYASLSGQGPVTMASVPDRRGTGSDEKVLSIAYPSVAAEAASIVDTAKTESLTKQDYMLPVKTVSTPKVQSEALGSGKPYCLVVASLTSEAKALEFIRTDGNPDLKILIQDGRYRVYLAEDSSREALISLRNHKGVSQRYPGAWVCERN